MSIAAAHDILRADLEPEFLETLARELAWTYDGLGEELAGNPCLNDGVREEEFNRRRGARVTETLARTAHRYGIPFEFRRLACNGQHKLIVKAGRVIMIQEPILYTADEPAACEYKKSLAAMHGFVRQLELDLGDIPHRTLDWSGCILAVLLHGPESLGFNQKKKLGSSFLAVPDADYRQWVLRLDLQLLAMYGSPAEQDYADARAAVQTDNVTVTAKRKNAERGISSK